MSENEQTNEKREMMADIVTELRKESKKVRTVTRPDGYGGYEEITLEGNPYFKNLADRIEAVWKRERAKVEADALEVGGIVEAARTAEKSSAVGNAAAMREALEDMYNILEKLQLYTPHINDVSLMRSFRGRICRAKKIANAALSEPARNCDLYANEADAIRAHEKAFDDDNFSNGECKLGCPGCDDFTIDCRVHWLFAPAKTKGENDGIK